ncbi:Oxidoreductase BOA17 [Apiospora saccharicola]|uniref:Oxidoreductase BOA17 n=1 Tax=Apiospora saccharicola TaxID=335842 RepID=A0ABR1TJ47_9PEZI
MEAKSSSEVAHNSPDSSIAPPRPKLLLPASCDPPMPNTPRKQLVWIVFGGTGHMGRSLVKCALSRGDLVTAVGRTFETSPEAMAQQHPGPNSLGLLCDVRARDSVARVVERTRQHFGRIDVVANCSGYGVIGACEDQDDHEIRNQFETNFMGTLHIIQASLPYFREQRGGRYLIFSSTSGALGVPGLGPYCATKYAVEGLIEAMLYEIDSFGVKATLVEPGLVRRDEPADEGGQEGAGHPLPLPTWGHFLIKPASEPYAHPASPALHAKRMVQWLGDKQPTSAVKCAELVWQLGHCAYPPLRLVLGSYAIESIRDRLRSVTEELEDWKHLHHAPPPEVLEAAAAAAAAAEAATTGNQQRRGSGSSAAGQQQQDKDIGPEIKAEGVDEDEDMAGESGGETQDQIMVIT